MIPTTKGTTVLLPSKGVDKFEHKPFSGDPVCFHKVDNDVQVMRSLIMPKKVTFLGTDGHKYAFLCKPKDDLRRDCRLIDFNNLLNKLFRKDPDCRKRDLRIRTYVSLIYSENVHSCGF